MPSVLIHYFGEPWDAPILDGDNCIRVPVPRYLRCYDCQVPFVEGDRGLLRPILDLDDARNPVVREGAIHTECDLLSTCGHVFGVCNCTMPKDMSRRDMALAALAALNKIRAQDGLGPL